LLKEAIKIEDCISSHSVHVYIKVSTKNDKKNHVHSVWFEKSVRFNLKNFLTCFKEYEFYAEEDSFFQDFTQDIYNSDFYEEAQEFDFLNFKTDVTNPDAVDLQDNDTGLITCYKKPISDLGITNNLYPDNYISENNVFVSLLKKGQYMKISRTPQTLLIEEALEFEDSDSNETAFIIMEQLEILVDFINTILFEDEFFNLIDFCLYLNSETHMKLHLFPSIMEFINERTINEVFSEKIVSDLNVLNNLSTNLFIYKSANGGYLSALFDYLTREYLKEFGTNELGTCQEEIKDIVKYHREVRDQNLSIWENIVIRRLKKEIKFGNEYYSKISKLSYFSTDREDLTLEVETSYFHNHDMPESERELRKRNKERNSKLGLDHKNFFIGSSSCFEETLTTLGLNYCKDSLIPVRSFNQLRAMTCLKCWNENENRISKDQEVRFTQKGRRHLSVEEKIGNNTNLKYIFDNEFRSMFFVNEGENILEMFFYSIKSFESSRSFDKNRRRRNNIY